MSLKKNKIKFIYFNNASKTNQIQEDFIFILNYLNELGFKTKVSEKKDQIIIVALGASSISKTLDFIKKIKK